MKQEEAFAGELGSWKGLERTKRNFRSVESEMGVCGDPLGE